MSIWGKIVGGAAGFALGGPIGALIGAAVGHGVDKMTDSPTEADGGARTDDATRQIAFTIGVIVLGAKLAKADGQVTKDEVSAFKRVFQIPPEEMKNVGRLFNQARKDAAGFEPYARQIGKMFHGNPAVLEELLHGLFHIARADGKVTQDEIDYLHQVSQIFGLDATTWNRIRAANIGADENDPYTILGIEPNASDDDVKAAHRKLVLENHPDKLVAQGMPPEFVALANDKLAKINAAHDQIRKDRGIT